MKRTVHKSQYFYGNKISEYGLNNGRLDYATLSRAFDAVLVNDITKLFYRNINGEFLEPEQINGIIDNWAQIDALNKKAEKLLNAQCSLDENSEEWEQIENTIEGIKDRIEELEREQDEPPEIYQYYIVSDAGAEILKEYTNDPVFYLPFLDCHIWGVPHWGTSWDYVLTDCEIVLEEG